MTEVFITKLFKDIGVPHKIYLGVFRGVSRINIYVPSWVFSISYVKFLIRKEIPMNVQVFFYPLWQDPGSITNRVARWLRGK